MESQGRISFDNTEIAFSHKSDFQLRKASFIFSLVSHPSLSRFVTSIVRLAFLLRLPIKGLIKSTAFSHFCGGETIEDCRQTIDQLGKYHVRTILDYSLEGATDEEGFDETTRELLRIFDFAKNNVHVPFGVFKVSGMADNDLLEKVQNKDQLSVDEEQAYAGVVARVDSICKKAVDTNVPVLIDAEESWYQDAIDSIAMEMMHKYNREKVFVFNTFQMYRAEMPDQLSRWVQRGKEEGFCVGVKLVRGAYMEKERERAEEKDFSDPIQPDKASTDLSFNRALEFCVQHVDTVSLICGSHNEYSNFFLTELMKTNKLGPDDKRIWFAQLMGMSDNISFNLSAAGYNVAKYVPYGPVKAVMPYLFRRAEENTSVSGQSGRELALIRKERKRRLKQSK